MQYEVITGLTEKEYNDLTKDEKFIHYKSDKYWNKFNNIDTVMYVGLKQKKKFIGCSKIEIYDNCFYVSNLTVLKNDDITLSLLLNEIYQLAKQMRIYKINILDIDTKEKKIGKLKSTKNYYLLKLQDKNKFYHKDYFQKYFSNDKTNLLSIKSKLNKKDINKLYDNLNTWGVIPNIEIAELLDTYKSKCVVNIETLDLVYYLNQIQSQTNPIMNQTTIEELIDVYGEEMIVGYSITLYPTNKQTAYCIALNTIDSFHDLNIKDNLIMEIINTSLKKKYANIIFINNINNTKDIYEFEYEIVLNKFKHFISKLKRK